MTEDLVKQIKFEQFQALLREVLDSKYGEVQYIVKVHDGRVALVTLSKTNTYKPESDNIKT